MAMRITTARAMTAIAERANTSERFTITSEQMKDRYNVTATTVRKYAKDFGFELHTLAVEIEVGDSWYTSYTNVHFIKRV